MAYPSAASSGPKLTIDLSSIVPYETTLKNGARVRLDRIVLPKQQSTSSTSAGVAFTSPATISGMRQIINHEIVDRGDTYPFEHALSPDQFEAYYFSNDTFCLRLVDVPPKGTNVDDNEDAQLVGCFYIKPNFPGRCSHVCNGGFLVRETFKSQGAGYIMAERYRHLAKQLGYRASMFNLVFVSNHGSNKLWEKLGFTKLSRVPGVGRLRDWESGSGGAKNPEVYRDAFQWYLELHNVTAFPYLPAAWERNASINGRPIASRSKL